MLEKELCAWGTCSAHLAKYLGGMCAPRACARPRRLRKAIQSSPHAPFRKTWANREGKNVKLRGRGSLGSRGARVSAGAALRWDHLCSFMAHGLYFSALARAPASLALGWYFSTRLWGMNQRAAPPGGVT